MSIQSQFLLNDAELALAAYADLESGQIAGDRILALVNPALVQFRPNAF
jgi:hypothetical protein